MRFSPLVTIIFLRHSFYAFKIPFAVNRPLHLQVLRSDNEELPQSEIDNNLRRVSKGLSIVTSVALLYLNPYAFGVLEARAAVQNPVTVIGSSGRTGKLVVESLVKNGIPVRASYRELKDDILLPKSGNVEVSYFAKS